MPSYVNIVMYNDQGTPLYLYRLSPGAAVSRQVNIGGGNILASIPFAGFFGVPMGLIEGNTVSVTGQMMYDHNSRKPITVLEEINNLAVFHNATGSTDLDLVNGRWHLILVDTVSSTETINYQGLPKMMTYNIVSGEGDICNYTIQLDLVSS
jgi:hypothetical protein